MLLQKQCCLNLMKKTESKATLLYDFHDIQKNNNTKIKMKIVEDRRRERRCKVFEFKEEKKINGKQNKNDITLWYP